MRHYTIFGFGSLINTESLRSSAPNAQPKPAYITGFRRSFNLWDPSGFTTTNLDVAGTPFCALDISKVSDVSARVNGVVFSVDETAFKELQAREYEYKLIKTICYDYVSQEPLGTCMVYSANKNNGTYDFESKAQRRYLDVCLDGAKEYGKTFYNEFLDTTFIGDTPLSA